MASQKISPTRFSSYVSGIILVILFLLGSTKIRSLLETSSLDVGSSFAGSDFNLLSRSDDGSCSITTPCSNGACCGGGSNGQLTYCGYGPTYCGESCLSNCNATAACGQYAAIPNTTCPLNVCCSQYGFCGTTELFCTTKCQSNCVLSPEPSPGGSSVDVRQKVIAYYEAWSSTRTCQQMLPAGLPIDGLTHVNFAFAYLKPDTFEIVSMDSTLPADLFQTVADVKTFKSGNQNLEVFVSIGGWDFTDESSDTQPLFGEIAGDPAKRQLFCDNALKFVNEYGLDGVDIDWEYPGAPDRGGTLEDTANFVLLLKSLRETFDSYPRTLSITFTIPSSYWYLQYFDLPSMIEYADWMNLMSYDLHGVWDSSDPIGNQIQAHTNLTEIKLAVELLWRVNIPPARVVLGTGFYGRAFQLSDPTCNTPGCPFSGAANPGVCTDAAGTLAYFEIMDIIKGDSSKSPLTHDTVDAVNYMTFDENQWVSFDNNVTFQQKVSWANGVGLGGLMIWSVDQDDSQFSALSGLLGRSLGGLGGDQQPIAITQDWSGQNGQSCTAFKECVDLDNLQVSSCGSGYTKIGYDAGGCSKGYGKPFCCPVNATPRSCIWRGGSTKFCDGQCHAGEVKLFGSSWGGEPTKGNQDKCLTGGKLFCCVADNWATALDDCSFGNCGGGCSSGYSSVTWKNDPVFCAVPVGGHASQKRDYCCPSPAKFGDCNWVGQGTCKDNACATDEVVLMTDSYGQTSSTCLFGGQKTCCCPPPQEPDFLPVVLSDIFPPNYLPPSQDLIKYDMQFPKGGSDPSTADAFGWVMIVGPPGAVSNANKGKRGTSASHIEFLNCHELSGTQRQTVKFVCTARGMHSNCNDMMEGGLKGTILEMPDKCGAGKYVVAHTVVDSEDQTIPWYLEGIKNTTVRELTFDYDFSLMKRDTGDVYIRMDYSNVAEYWDDIVNSSPAKRALQNRFWSTSDSSWGLKFQQLELDAHKREAAGTQFDDDFVENLLSFVKPCSPGASVVGDIHAIGSSSSAFADINAIITVSAIGYMGFSMIGILSATTQQPITFIESYSFIDTEINTDVTLEVSVNGEFQVPYTAFTLSKIFSNNGYSHPGLISVTPTLVYDVAFTADISLEANFTTGTHAWTNTSILQALPLDSQSVQGQTAQNNPSGDDGKPLTFQGEVYAISGDTFKLDFRPRMGLKIVMEEFGTSDISFGAFAENSLDTYNAITFDSSDSSFSVVQGTGSATGTVTYDVPGTIISAWDSNADTDNVINNAPGAAILWTSMPGESHEVSGNGPAQHTISNDSTSIFWSIADGIQCPSNLLFNDSLIVTCPTSLCVLIPGLCTDIDAEFDPGSEDEALIVHGLMQLTKRGARQKYPVALGDGSDKANTFYITSQPYPSYGVLFNGSQADQVFNRSFEYLSRNDCGNCDVIDYPRDEINTRVTGMSTEHILELQTIPRFLTTAATGILPSGRMMTARRISASFFRNSWNAASLPASLPNVGADFRSQVPNDRVFEALGSNSNRANFVATATDLNGVKARIWGLRTIMDDNVRDAALNAALNTRLPQAQRNTARESVLGTIRAVRATFSYLNEDPDITQRLRAIAAEARVQIQLIESNLPAASGLTAIWDEFLLDRFQTMQQNSTNFMTTTIMEVRTRYNAASPPPPDLAQVTGILNRLQAEIGTIGMPQLP